MQYRLTQTVTPQEKREIVDALWQYNISHMEVPQIQEFALYAEDGSAAKQGGLVGFTHGAWMTVQYLWVAQPARGQGVGRSLLQQAEAFALQQGCRTVFLDTFDFQAPEFYRACGYQEVLRLEGYPVTGTHFFFTKALQSV